MPKLSQSRLWTSENESMWSFNSSIFARTIHQNASQVKEKNELPFRDANFHELYIMKNRKQRLYFSLLLPFLYDVTVMTWPAFQANSRSKTEYEYRGDRSLRCGAVEMRVRGFNRSIFDRTIHQNASQAKKKNELPFHEVYIMNNRKQQSTR